MSARGPVPVDRLGAARMQVASRFEAPFQLNTELRRQQSRNRSFSPVNHQLRTHWN